VSKILGILYFRLHGIRSSNQILHGDPTTLADKFYRVDHATCPGQKCLWYECWRAICLRQLTFLLSRVSYIACRARYCLSNSVRHILYVNERGYRLLFLASGPQLINDTAVTKFWGELPQWERKICRRLENFSAIDRNLHLSRKWYELCAHG